MIATINNKESVVSTLREMLKQKDNDLYTKLMQSWEEAKKWFPQIPSRDRSYNCRLHVENLESYLNRIISEYGSINQENQKGEILSAVEIYVILMAILYHDYGKIQNIEGHGTLSRIELQKNYSNFKIPSSKFADVIGRICEFHAPKYQHGGGESPVNLVTTAIAPYGRIRCRELAALLVLVDRMDSAFTRIVPDYIKTDEQDKQTDFKATFRSYINDVYLCSRKHTIYTVIEKPESVLNTKSRKRDSLRYFMNPDKDIILGVLRRIKPSKKISDFRLFMKNDIENLDISSIELKVARKLKQYFTKKNNEDFNVIISFFKLFSKNNRTSKDQVFQHAQEMLLKCGITDKESKVFARECQDLFNSFDKVETIFNSDSNMILRNIIGDEEIFGKVECLIALNIIHVDGNTMGNKSIPHKMVLAAILGDLRRNVRALEDIKEGLSRLGIMVGAWRLQYDDHLYDENGQEVFEAIFSTEYLMYVARRMWDLSIRIFGPGYLTYRNLAAEIRENDIEKVKLAVKRLSIIAEGIPDIRKNNLGIWWGHSTWKWLVSHRKSHCNYLTLDQLKRRLEGFYT